MTARKLAIAPLLATLLLACSGADNQDLFAPSAQQNDTATSPPASSSGGASQSSDGTEPSGGGSGSGSAQTSNVPPPPPPPAAPACPQETEPNDSLKTATTFTSNVCGQIGDHGDVDYVQVVAPDGAKSMTWQVQSSDGKITYRLYANGFPIPTGEGGDLPVLAGVTYAWQLEGGHGAKPTWEVDVTFD